MENNTPCKEIVHLAELSHWVYNYFVEHPEEKTISITIEKPDMHRVNVVYYPVNDNGTN